jgi:CBS domain-containing protein
LPVIILTGHGGFDEAMAGIELEVVDFLQKPVNVEKLAQHVRRLLAKGGRRPLRERPVAELMVPIDSYRRVDEEDPVGTAIEAMQETIIAPSPGKVADHGHRSILVYRGGKKFVGLIRILDLIRVVIPPYLRDSEYASFFTGMFLAQCKTLGALRIGSLIDRDLPAIDPDTPLMEALHLMASRKLINLPVLRDGELVGILRDKDLLLEIANSVGPT